jgi:prevent-host-death family protein
MTAKLPQTLNIGVTEVRKKLGSLLNLVQKGEEHVVVEKLSTPVAAIISIQDYEQYRRLLAQRIHRELGRKVGVEALKQGLNSEQLLEEIGEIRKTLFKEDYAELV